MSPANDGAPLSWPRTGGLKTLGDWLGFAERLYTREKLAFGQVAANAHDEALYLLLHALGLPLDSRPRVLKKNLDADQRAKVDGILRRRVLERVPAAYLTQEAWLGGQRFFVDERVIIPRSYFVEVIPGEMDLWIRSPARVKRVADVCTGSGCLAILLALHFPKARVDAIDLSPAALEVAKINVKAHGLTRRVTLFASDVFASVPPAKYDVIVCNPPYEPSAHVDAMPQEFHREPRLALDGGRDGLDIIRRLLREAGGRLAQDGIVIIEVGGLRAAMDREFAALEPHWISTADGSDCVCVIHAARIRMTNVE